MALIRKVISTHTPTQGVTPQQFVGKVTGCDFYSHAHAGRDYEVLKGGVHFEYFYSHAHAGRDMGLSTYKIRKKFLLTRPRRA